MRSRIAPPMFLLFAVLFSSSSALAQVEPLIPIDWPNFMWPYNAHYPLNENGPNGHEGNSCGPMSMTRILRYWEWPVQGEGSVSYTDPFSGEAWSAVFDTTHYNYERMPHSIDWNAPESEFWEAARLVHDACASTRGYHGSPSVGMDYMLAGFKNFLHYSDDYTVLNAWEMNPKDYQDSLVASLDAGCPILITGRTPDSPAPGEPGTVAGHYWLIDGYAAGADTTFHIVFGFGDYDYYYPALSMPVYSAYNTVVVGLHPESPSGSIEITSPVVESLPSGAETTISWNSSGVETVRLLVSTNGGWDYELIADNVPASTGSYSWTAPSGSIDDCRVKVESTNDPNVRDRSSFVIFSASSVEVETPGGGTLVAGVEAPIAWEASGLAGTVDLEYSDNGGQSWNSIATGIDATAGYYLWTVPITPAPECVVRVRSSMGIEGTSSSFAIVDTAPFGGPFPVDDETLMLLHFDRTIVDASGTISAIGQFGSLNQASSGLAGYDQGLRIVNTTSVVYSCLKVDDRDEIDLQDDFTIELWFKMESINGPTTTYPHLLFKGGDENSGGNAAYNLMLNADNGVMAQVALDGGDRPMVVSGSPLTTGEWLHLMLLRDSSQNTLRLVLHDEDLVKISDVSTPCIGTLANTTGPLYLGGVNYGSNTQFDGWVEELRISDTVRDVNVVTSVPDAVPALPEGFALTSVYPNPFNSTAVVRFSLSRSSRVNLGLYDLLGREVQRLSEATYSAGEHALTIRPDLHSSGVYFIRMETEQGSSTRRIHYVK